MRGGSRRLDRWAEDRRSTLPEKLQRQREARALEGERDEAWRASDQASRELDRQKDRLLDEIGTRLEQRARLEPLFMVRWRLE